MKAWWPVIGLVGLAVGAIIFGCCGVAHFILWTVYRSVDQ